MADRETKLQHLITVMVSNLVQRPYDFAIERVDQEWSMQISENSILLQIRVQFHIFIAIEAICDITDLLRQSSDDVFESSMFLKKPSPRIFLASSLCRLHHILQATRRFRLLLRPNIRFVRGISDFTFNL